MLGIYRFVPVLVRRVRKKQTRQQKERHISARYIMNISMLELQKYERFF